MSYTANKWTDDEKSYVISKFKSGKSIDDIANSGKITRSKYAIELKVYNTIYDMLQMGMTPEEVAEDFNRSKKEIVEIEKKIFDMKQNDMKQNNEKSKVKIEKNTPYFDNGGYKYNSSNNFNDLNDLNDLNDINISSTVNDFNDIHHFNRTMHIVLNFYENIDRLNTLKKNKTIDDDFYNDLIKKTNNFVIDKEKILNSLNNIKEFKDNNNDIEDKPKKKSKENSKNKDDNDNDNDNNNNNNDADSIKDSKKNKDNFKSTKSSKYDNDDGKYDEVPKKLKKRLF
jgi:hypothetical protein